MVLVITTFSHWPWGQDMGHILKSHYLMHRWIPVYIFKRNKKSRKQNLYKLNSIYQNPNPVWSSNWGWESGICIVNEHFRSFCKVIQGLIVLGEHNFSSSHTAFILSPDHDLLCSMPVSKHIWILLPGTHAPSLAYWSLTRAPGLSHPDFFRLTQSCPF